MDFLVDVKKEKEKGIKEQKSHYQDNQKPSVG